jgi:hypothetical protein
VIVAVVVVVVEGLLLLLLLLGASTEFAMAKACGVFRNPEEEDVLRWKRYQKTKEDLD